VKHSKVELAAAKRETKYARTRRKEHGGRASSPEGPSLGRQSSAVALLVKDIGSLPARRGDRVTVEAKWVASSALLEMRRELLQTYVDVQQIAW
jgi:hypothetical protein